jgi:hypothetical protein
MTRKAFCVERGVSAHTLDYYRRKSRGGAQVAPQLLPVALVGASPRGLSHGSLLRVELANGRRIVVEEGFDSSLLRRVIAALEA